MYGQHKFEQYIKANPQHRHKNFFERPHWTQRNLEHIMGNGEKASKQAGKEEENGVAKAQVSPENKGMEVIFDQSEETD